MKNIAIVEDEKDLSNLVVKYLHSEGKNTIFFIPKSARAAYIKELETKLIGMETAKRCGAPINLQTLNEAESLLNKVKSSSRYSHYQQRINALK